MPGNRLSNDEQKLQDKWGTINAETPPYLTKITVIAEDGCVGIRGIQHAELDIRFPVSVLVGPNGSGKSTLLALAALAFSGDDHIPLGRPKAGYTFTDFFARTTAEPSPINLAITWQYSHGEERRIRRRTTKKWMHYESRTKRPVVFVGVGRITDPADSGGHRRTFSRDTRFAQAPMSKSGREALSRIMDVSYESVDLLSSGKFSLPTVKRDAAYSGFNMGTGEMALVELVAALYDSPRGSLVLIEEVELGLHASILRRLAKEIVSAAKSRDLQVITTSHNEWFIDALPRQARMLVMRENERHLVLTGVTTRFATRQLTGQEHPELTIVCEDMLADAVLQLALPSDIRSRVRIIPVGAKQNLAPGARALAIASPKTPILIVWDGDVPDSEVRQFHSASNIREKDRDKRVEWDRLPELMGEDGKLLPPERAIQATVLGSPEAVQAVAGGLGSTPESFEDALRSCSALPGSHHDLFSELSRTLSADEAMVRTLVLAQYKQLVSWTSIVTRLERMLDHGAQQFAPPTESDTTELQTEDPTAA